MHRVELKDKAMRFAKKDISPALVPNAPCGVERFGDVEKKLLVQACS